MRTFSTTISTLCLLFAIGCGGDAKKEDAGEKKAEGPTESHTCKIIVAVDHGDTKYSGNGATEDEALAAACEKIPEDQRGECKNEDKFSKATATMTLNDQTQFTVTLKPKSAEFEAEKASDESQEIACTAALEEACKAAGETGDCVASGKYRKTGEMASSTRM
jgi:hypothetical protein